MRTKTLLLTAVLSAAGLATSMAQVFSVNAVGYVRVNVVPQGGFQMIANPLDAEDNTIPALLSNAPDGTTVFKFDPSEGFSVNTLFFGTWTIPDQELAPGEGAFIQVPGADPLEVVFVGEVPQGSLENPIPAGFSIRASQVPQEGLLQTDLEFPAVDGDLIFTFNTETQAFDQFTLFFGSWSPEEPVIEVGQAFFVNKLADTSWDREFSVNN